MAINWISYEVNVFSVSNYSIVYYFALLKTQDIEISAKKLTSQCQRDKTGVRLALIDKTSIHMSLHWFFHAESYRKVQF